jgi:hypothetical protein
MSLGASVFEGRETKNTFLYAYRTDLQVYWTSPHRSRIRTRSTAHMRRCRSSSLPLPRCRTYIITLFLELDYPERDDESCFETSASGAVPSDDLGEGLDVAVDHLLLGGALPAGLVNHDEPVLVVAAREQRRHFRGPAVPAPTAGSHRGVAVPAGAPRHPAREAEAVGRDRGRAQQMLRGCTRRPSTEERGDGEGGGAAGEEPPGRGCCGGGHGG